jgi:hypothetical protein
VKSLNSSLSSKEEKVTVKKTGLTSPRLEPAPNHEELPLVLRRNLGHESHDVVSPTRIINRTDAHTC